MTERTQAALEVAKRLNDDIPHLPNLLKLLGKAQFRLGHYTDAIEAFAQSEEWLYSEKPVVVLLDPFDHFATWDNWRFTAMAQFHLGRRDEAAASLSSLRELYSRICESKRANNRLLAQLCEAEALIEGPIATVPWIPSTQPSDSQPVHDDANGLIMPPATSGKTTDPQP